MSLTHGSLFAGIGGIDIGFMLEGFETKWYIEKDRYARQILKRLTLQNLKDLSYCLVDSHVKTSHLPENSKEVLKAPEVVYGKSSQELLGFFDQNGSLLKTHQSLFGSDLIKCSSTLPTSGIMLNGRVYRHPPWELHTSERDVLSLHGVRYPTMTTTGMGGSNQRKAMLESGGELREMAYGLINPEFAEWLMGFPIGWTGLDVLETQSFRSSRDYSQEELEVLKKWGIDD